MPPPPPVPPPPPPVGNVGKGKIATQSSGDRGALLADIRQPKALKKTVTNDRSAPLVDANKNKKVNPMKNGPIIPDMGRNKVHGLQNGGPAVPGSRKPSVPEDRKPSLTPPSPHPPKQSLTPQSPHPQQKPSLTPLSTHPQTLSNKRVVESNGAPTKTVYNRQKSVDVAKIPHQVDNESGGTISVKNLRSQFNATLAFPSPGGTPNTGMVTPPVRVDHAPPPPPSPAKKPSIDTGRTPASSRPVPAGFHTIRPQGKKRPEMQRRHSQENLKDNKTPPAPPPRIDSIKPGGGSSLRPAPPPPPPPLQLRATVKPSIAPPPPPSVHNRVSLENVVFRSPNPVPSGLNHANNNFMSPPATPLAVKQIRSSSQDFESRYKFRGASALPSPDNFTDTIKTYKKATQQQKRNAPPPPPVR